MKRITIPPPWAFAGVLTLLGLVACDDPLSCRI